MKQKILAVMSFLAVSQTVAAIAGVNVDINVGVPAAPYVASALTLAAPPEVVFESQPRFIFSPALGFYVTVGAPYDIAYIGSNYYLYRGGSWFVGPTYSGPWKVAKDRSLPKSLRKFPYDKIRYYRDQEYQVYQRDPAHYRGRMHEPEWKRKEPHKAERRNEEPRREERRAEHEREERH